MAIQYTHRYVNTHTMTPRAEGHRQSCQVLTAIPYKAGPDNSSNCTFSLSFTVAVELSSGLFFFTGLTLKLPSLTTLVFISQSDLQVFDLRLKKSDNPKA